MLSLLGVKPLLITMAVMTLITGTWIGILAVGNRNLTRDLLAERNATATQKENIRQKQALIDDYIRKGDEQKIRLDEAMKQAELNRVKADERLRALAMRPVPADPAKQVDYLYEEAGKLTGTWRTK